MNTCWIPLRSIPQGGQTLVYDDQDLWRNALREYGVPCELSGPLRAEVFVLPQEDGVLFRGRIAGKVIMPCDRCSESSLISLEQRFDSFEPYPREEHAPARAHAPARPALQEDAADDAIDEAVMRVAPHGKGIEINPAALAWEEISLALPVKPLCSEDCKGLCPVCGCNRNQEPCSCVPAEGDPRLAVLRNITIAKK